MSYPTPGGSPQETHARLKSGSPSESGKSRSASVTSGQSTNIDVIISRLQSELTRSQETNADLGALKQGLGDLERSITVSKDEGKTNGDNGPEALTAAHAVEYKRLLEENNQAYTIEVAKMTKMMTDAQAEIDAYVQKIQLLEPLVAEDEILRRDIAQNSAELTKVRLERDLAKDSMNELITEHQQTMEYLRREHEAVMAALEATHKEKLERFAHESALAQELLLLKHQGDLEKAIQSTAVPAVDSTKEKEVATLQLEVSSLTTQVSTLRLTVEMRTEEVKELSSEKAVLTRELAEAKAVVVKAEKELKEAKLRAAQAQENITALTPTSPTNKAEDPVCKECRSRATATTTITSTKGSKDVVTGEFSWIEFVFPMSKKDQSRPFNQSSSAMMSGGVMLVGIGAYVFWLKSGARA